MSFRAATAWSLFYVAAALAFGAALGIVAGWSLGTQFLAGYVVEKSLSVDNLFVFVVIMSTFAVPRESQPRVLGIGIAMALVLRADLYRGSVPPARGVLVHVRDLRDRADRHRRAPLPPPRREAVREQQPGRGVRAPPAAAHPAGDHVGGDRDDRLPVRARLDPRGVRSHPAPVHRARGERVRAPRPAPAVLRRLGPARSPRVSVDGAGGDPGVHRRQARAALRAPATRLGPRGLDRRVARGDRGRARRHHDHESRARQP